MDKKLIIGAIAAGVIGFVAAQKRKSGMEPATPHEMRRRVQDRMRRRMEQMPEDFPPRIVRDYVPAIKADTERILELLSEQPPRPGGATPAGDL